MTGPAAAKRKGINVKASQKERAAGLVLALKEIYPEASCALRYEGEPWKLLVMGRLSAQCTDKRVNEVCLTLFTSYPTARSLADAPVGDIENIIRSCGLYKTKARNIKDECSILCEKFGGVPPDDMDALLTFPGVGRKIANLVLGDIYKKPAIVADTHCIRLCGRFGFTPEDEKDPFKVEKKLSAIVEPDEQSDLCHRLVLFGREYCRAQNPRCAECPLSELCRSEKKKITGAGVKTDK